MSNLNTISLNIIIMYYKWNRWWKNDNTSQSNCRI